MKKAASNRGLFAFVVCFRLRCSKNMRILSLDVGLDSGRPWLALRNEGSEPVRVLMVALQRGNAGPSPYILFSPPLCIGAGGSCWSSDASGRFNSNPPAVTFSEWLIQGLRGVLQHNEEAVIRVHVDLEPPQAERDQLAPSFFVVRAEDNLVTAFFPLQGSLQGQPSLLDALLESRRHGA